jgi:hypothetical protein
MRREERGQRGKLRPGAGGRFDHPAGSATVPVSIGRDRLEIGEAKAALITKPRQAKASRSGMSL